MGTALPESLFESVNLWVTMGEGRERADDVLVVDDNPGDLRFIEEALGASQLSLNIRTVNSREEALDSVYQRGEYEDTPKPAAIMLDWNLSHETGREVVSAAKSGDSHIPVLVMTGSYPAISDVESELSEADLFMEKPTEPEGYIEPLQSLLSDQ